MEPKVKFYLHSPESNQPTPIEMVLNYGFSIEKVDKKKSYKRLKMSTGRSIHPKDWSQEEQHIPSRSHNPKKIIINAELGTLAKKAMDSLHFFTIQNQLPSAEQLKLKILDDRPIQLYNKITPIIPYIQNYYDTCGAPKNTKKNYKRLLNKLEEYKTERKVILIFETINAEILRDFFKFIGDRKITYRQKEWDTTTANSLADYKKNMRKFCNMAASEGITISPQYKLKEFTPVYEVADAVYLTMRRIKDLIKFDLVKAGREGLQLTKDLLIISCYTALRNSDWKRIGNMYAKPNGKAYINIRTKKSKKKKVASLPVYAPVMEIYKRYGNRFPTPQTDQKYNISVKELGKLMGWDEIVKVGISRVFDKEEDRIESYPFYKLLSSHTGRRSFATNAYIAGVSPKFIMQFTNHTKISDFFNYIKLTAEQDTDQFYEQTKDFFEPNSNFEDDSFVISSGNERPWNAQSSKRNKPHPVYKTSGHRTLDDSFSRDLPFRTE